MKYTMKDFKFGDILIDKNRDKWFCTKEWDKDTGRYKFIIIQMNKGIIETYSVEEFKENFDFYLRARNKRHEDMIEVILSGCAKSQMIDRPYLDNVELDYLKNVIRPFKDRVKFICVFRTPDFEERKEVALLIKTGEINTHSQRTIILPNFKVGTMYKGMKLDREYTLEELGITYE